MNELAPSNSKPKPTNSPEVGALNDLLNLMNNPAITGAEVPPGEETKVQLSDDKTMLRPPPETELAAAKRKRAEAAVKAKAVELERELKKVAAQPIMVSSPESTEIATVTPPPPVADNSRLFFTGRTGAGKDYLAAAAKAKIFGFADPLYYLASHFFGLPVSSTVGKDTPGMRVFLQVIGQWGRNIISEQYPLTTDRAAFVTMIRSLGAAGILSKDFGVDWESFGRNPDIWLEACLSRVDAFRKEHPGQRVAITNCRFENEFKRLKASGFAHWHIMCSANTWAVRLAKAKLTPDAPALKDLSEKLAATFDTNVIKQISAVRSGVKLTVVWNDDAPPPSERLHTIKSFLQTIG